MLQFAAAEAWAIPDSWSVDVSDSLPLVEAVQVEIDWSLAAQSDQIEEDFVDLEVSFAEGIVHQDWDVALTEAVVTASAVAGELADSSEAALDRVAEVLLASSEEADSSKDSVVLAAAVAVDKRWVAFGIVGWD